MELRGLAIEGNGDVCRWIPTSVARLEVRRKWNGPSAVEGTFTNATYMEINISLLNFILSCFEFNNLKSLKTIDDGQQAQAQLLFEKLPNLETLTFPADRNIFSREEFRTKLKVLVVHKIDDLIIEPVLLP